MAFGPWECQLVPQGPETLPGQLKVVQVCLPALELIRTRGSQLGVRKGFQAASAGRLVLHEPLYLGAPPH